MDQDRDIEEEERELLEEVAADLVFGWEKNRTEKELHITKLSVDMATTPIFWIDPAGWFIYVNQAVCRHLGYSRKEVLAMDVGDIDPNYPMEKRKEFWRNLQKEKKLTMETVHRRKDGTLIPVEATTNYVEFWGVEYEFVFVADITERKRAQEQIERDLKIKETLLQEIHHRVKNNFTVICSLLNLQSGKIDSKEDAVKAFHNSRQRIHSMLLVHENLYRARNLSHIDMKEYIETMIRDLLPVHQSNKKIHVNLEIMNVYLDINAAIPCGLILNEIITNAFKHAFTGRSEGMVFVSFRPNEDNRYELIVRDDGEGLPNQFDINAADTLGLQLIALLTEQIDGSLDIKNERGTEFRILFPKKI
jgi:PAS domain S-box-containing protein